jgi:hypothetical protein
MFSVCFKGFLAIVIAGNTDLIWREGTVVQFTDVLFNSYLSSTKGGASERWKARWMCWQQKEESRREFDDVCGSCHTFAFLYIFPISFHHPFIYFSVYSRYSQITKNLDEITEFPTFLRAGLSGYIDAFIVGEKKRSFATVCEERTVPHTALCLCFLYYCFWNLFAITERRLKFKKSRNNTIVQIDTIIASLAGCSWGHPESLLSALCNLHMRVSGKYLHSRCTRVRVLHVPGSGCQLLFIHN